MENPFYSGTVCNSLFDTMFLELQTEIKSTQNKSKTSIFLCNTVAMLESPACLNLLLSLLRPDKNTFARHLACVCMKILKLSTYGCTNRFHYLFIYLFIHLLNWINWGHFGPFSLSSLSGFIFNFWSELCYNTLLALIHGTDNSRA